MPHRFEDLDETGGACGGDQVSEVCFERTHNEGAVTVRFRQRSELRRVADLRARGVALDVGDVLRGQPGLAERLGHRHDLAAAGGRQETTPSAVVRQAHAADDAVDHAAFATCVFEAHERDKRGPFARQKSIGVGIKRPALPARAQRTEGAEAHVNKEVVGAIDGAGDHHVRAALLKGAAGKLDGVERGRAGGVEAVAAGGEAKLGRDEMRRKTRVKAVLGAGFNAKSAAALAEPVGFSEARVAFAWKPKVAHDETDAASGAAAVFKGLAHDVSAHRKDRIELTALPRRVNVATTL